MGKPDTSKSDADVPSLDSILMMGKPDGTSDAPKPVILMPTPTSAPAKSMLAELGPGRPIYQTANLVPLEEEWAEAKAPDGRTYYYNKRTKQTSWTKPALGVPSTSEKPKPVAMDSAPVQHLVTHGHIRYVSNLKPQPIRSK
eukprot:TRINITY_DN1378_c0_g1_i5.p1 TRINITY_DN1378_c0_g1~~TRINITY_DN1378_c0_g1_i5.p1  ORF type:complete len:151 (+),score=17.45 TRINITY_DN1378_c0_g1_i5:30-455(+)